jgi:hemerythrin
MSMLIEWKKEFELGVPEIDTEHRELIELINSTYAALQAQRQSSNIMAFLGEIFAKISAHFALEESIMRKYRYDGYLEHKKEHEKLLDDIRDIMDDYEDGIMPSEDELSRRLTDWFSEHFRTQDARLHKRLH